MSAEPSTSAKKPFGNRSIKNAAIPQPRSRTHLKVMDETPAYNGLIEGLRARLGPHGVLTGPADTAPYCEDWRRLYHGRTPAVLRPAATAEVADAVRLCAACGVPIVPQGGNTSMVGGAAVSEDGSQIILSLSRMNKVRAIDPVDMTMEIEAGVTLKAAQEAAAEVGCLLPLSISSEGSAQIGGVLATNAGGNNTVRYGNARDLVLGLEVVLPDGQVWNGRGGGRRSKRCWRRRGKRVSLSTPSSARVARSAPCSGNSARSIPRRRNWPAPR